MGETSLMKLSDKDALTNGSVTSLHNHSFPELFIGAIIPYYGLLSNLPSNWHVCDGQGGARDLRGLMIMGASSDGEVGTTGGSSTLTHSGSAVADHAAKLTDAADVGATQRGTTATTLTLKAHKHNITAYTHSVTQPSNHIGVYPPFMKLYYVQRIF